MNLKSLFFRNLALDFSLEDDIAHQRLFREYGAVFIARGGVIPPSKVVYEDESDVREFQDRLNIKRANVGGLELELQAAAMDSLLDAVDEAGVRGLSINARGPDSATRNYNGTVELWRSRVEPGLAYWCAKGKITEDVAEMIRSLPPYEQVEKILELEEQQIYFAKDLSKSIIYSVAPPGASQHLSALAFDVAEFENAEVRRILARHQWYQTVTSDLPHFTFLGIEESDLPSFGLKKVESGRRDFWIPDV